MKPFNALRFFIHQCRIKENNQLAIPLNISNIYKLIGFFLGDTHIKIGGTIEDESLLQYLDETKAYPCVYSTEEPKKLDY